MDWDSYLAFRELRAEDLDRIAGNSTGEKTAEDVWGDALLMADYLGAKRGFEIDWLDLEDQELILKKLRGENITRKKGERRLTISVSVEREDDDGNTIALINLLSAEETADPLVLLEYREEEEKERARKEEEDAILDSYSQSVAYNIAIWHFDNIRRRLAAYLAIDRNTLSDRITKAAAALKIQSSLFDGIETISNSFLPERGYGRPSWLPANSQLDNAQWCWEFEEDITPVQSALSRLRHNELCEVVSNGIARMARWHRTTRLFFFTDGDRPVFCTASEAREWWPATVEF